MSRILHFPETIASKLVDRFRPDAEEGSRRAFNEMLLLLNGGDREEVRRFYIRKYTRVILTVLVMILVLLTALTASYLVSRQVDGGRLLRPGYSQSPREIELTVLAEDESEVQEIPLSVTVSGRRYTDHQVKDLLRKAEEEFDEHLPGENVSVDEVRSPLFLPETLLNGAVQVTYVMIPYGIIGQDGSILGKADPEGTLVEIQARLTCQGEVRELLRTVRVLPKELTEDEAFLESVREGVRQADESEMEEDYLTLPPESGGRTLTWQYPKEPWVRLAIAALLILPLLIWYLSDSRMKEKGKEREAQLKLDYGELMWKMTMLSGAGLTIRAVFFRIAGAYMEEKGDTPRYVYEEIVRTCREMKSGVPEGTAYENFGRRCALQPYVRLGSLLSQNLKKGTKGLTELLEKEASSAMEERRSQAREAGEKASTKLLLPMILLLGVVLIALTLPCVLAL